MMSTTTLVATGTTVIVVARRKSTKSHIARSASAKIVKPSSKSARKRLANVAQPVGKATRDATIKTTTARAIGMAETAVARKTATNIAKSASVWIPKIKSAADSVDPPAGPTMASATTTTTTVVVAGIKGTAAAFPGKRISSSSAMIASAWILTTKALTRKSRDAAASVSTRIGKATVYVILATTTAPAVMTKGIAVAIRATRNSSNSAKLRAANAKTLKTLILQRRNLSYELRLLL